MKDARTFGVAWLGDEAMIKRRPLLNMLAFCGEGPPVVISIFDCSDHMSEGGEKDVEYIQQLFKNKIDAFFFDGASNVQKLEKFSVQHIHGHFVFIDKHVLSLFSVILLISNQTKWVCKIFICPSSCSFSCYFRISF